jgi:hypothetical protein
MIFLYALISLLGALATFAALWPSGWPVAIAGALLGGNALVALASFWLNFRLQPEPRTAAPDSGVVSLPKFGTALPKTPAPSPSASAREQRAA